MQSDCEELGCENHGWKLHEQTGVLFCECGIGYIHGLCNGVGANSVVVEIADAHAAEDCCWGDSYDGLFVSLPLLYCYIYKMLRGACSVGVVSCIRLSTLYILMNSPDLTWATTDALMWCAIELNLGIVGGCVTAMRPFVRRYFPKLLGLSYGGYGSYSHSRKYGHPLNSIPRSDNPNLSGHFQQYSTSTWKGETMGDWDSEEQVLKEAAAPPALGSGKADGIVRTVEFDIENGVRR